MSNDKKCANCKHLLRIVGKETENLDRIVLFKYKCKKTGKEAFANKVELLFPHPQACGGQYFSPKVTN